ncbi:proton-conducting transporter membrane subunit [Micromonospora sp. NPDC049679]|uniref:NADH-quinone oxidoreductase subunit N n=1 Tax=Micromonospora sp. NPDC049679 TaxID=3155920 RepID=UPI0033E8DB82
MTQAVDSLALLPAYLAAGTAVLVLLADLFVARRGATLAVAIVGSLLTAVAAGAAATQPARATFCTGMPAPDAVEVPPDCSYVADGRAALVAVLFALLTAAVLALSAPALRVASVPAGEYCFLLACSMTGGVVLGAAGDLITLIVALETLTLPLYVLVGLRRRAVASAEAAVTFFVVSVVATAVTLLGAALLYAANGAVHLDLLHAASATESPGMARLSRVAVVLLLVGLAFKVAAVPLHAWAPTTYDGAPLPVAAYLSTASKLGGVVAILYVVVDGLWPWAEVSGVALAILAVLTMTVGNVVALRQTRTVRLLAWSSVAQAGYILAPLGAAATAAGRTNDARTMAVAAAVAYTIFYVVLELAAFAALVALRPAGADGGSIAEYRGAARRHPWVGAALVLALIGLAGLPPGLAGLFAKVAVVRSLVGGGAGWLAVLVALNAVVGLAYYVRVSAVLYAPTTGEHATPARVRVPWPVAVALGGATLVALVVGFAPQFVLDAALR